jgi:polysaccharide export outer membrane protein
MKPTTSQIVFAALVQGVFVLTFAAAPPDTNDAAPSAGPDPSPPPAAILPPLETGVDAAVALPTIASPDHPVGAEDLLEISVFEIPDLNRIVRVSEKGTISLPLLGEMEVRGLTTMQLEDHLREALSLKYLQDPQVSVFVREFGSKKVSVIGAVGKPGVYQMLGPRTLLQVLSEAGGLGREAGSHLFVIRSVAGGATDAIPVKIGDLLMNRDPELNLAVNPGDIISVPIDRPVYIYVDGAVKTPGRLEELESRPITLLQAIAKAGGVTERANLKSIQILRRGSDGMQGDLRVSLKKIRQGKDRDPVLEEGDVVVVPETFF